MKRSALLVIRPLASISAVRLAAGFAAGILLPLWILGRLGNPETAPSHLIPVLFVWAGCVVAELAERYLFFAAVSAPRMPGGVRS